MDKLEILEWLKNSLEIRLYTERTSVSYYESANTKTTVSVFLDGEKISEAENTVYD